MAKFSLFPQNSGPMLRENWKSDLISGFLVFLIALPLSLGISMASGFPPAAGLITAIIGGLVVSFFGGSQLTIKGPAAGLIVIALGAVEEFGQGDPMKGYQMALAAIVVSGFIQVLLGKFKSGILSEIFPSAAVHGMMAAIGIIIISKQVHTLLGVKPEGKETIDFLMEIPNSLGNFNPEIALIGIISLLILFLMPLIPLAWVKKVPAPLLVILVAIPMGHWFQLETDHTYLFLNHHIYEAGPRFLVTLPQNFFNAVTFPDFSQWYSWVMLKYVITFTLVGSLESLLSLQAIDALDPQHRKSNVNRDLMGVGFGNILAGLLGGLPMIAEIVRSSSNIHNGGKTWWSNVFHGGFIFIFVVFFPGLIHQIPLAALAAMLIFTGYRLASPKEFYKTWLIGKEQLAIFLTTILITLVTDLLLGILSGMLLKLLFHLMRGLSFKNIFVQDLSLEVDGSQLTIVVRKSAVFSNFLQLKRMLDGLPHEADIILDLHQVELIDHTVITRIIQIQADHIRRGGAFKIVGLDQLKPVSGHEKATRTKDYRQD